MTSYSIIGGTGDLGGALAERLAERGYEVWIGSRDPAKGQAAAAAIAERQPGAKVFGAGLADAAAKGDMCFLTVPYAAHQGTLEQIRDAVQGRIVVDATVPLKPPKVGTVQLPAAGCAVLEAAALLGEGVRLVSALQTIGAEKLAAGGPIDSEVLVAGDDAEAVELVREVLGKLGLKSWHVGPLANSAAAEAMTSVLIQLNRRYKLVQSGLKITAKAKTPAGGLSVLPVQGVPMIEAGHDLAQALGEALAAAGPALQDGDVVVVAQKVVSKAEDRAVALDSVTPGAAAKDAARTSAKDPRVVELIAAESQELMRVAPGVVISRHRSGHVLANAGIDASNVPGQDTGERVVLWPLDPDASARRLREALQARFGVRLAVIVSDSLGRAWRLGTTGTAIGSAGLKPLRDRRGETDLFGRELQATLIGVADEIAGAASLVMGEAAEGTPAAVVRGATYDPDETAGVGAILRPLQEDLFK